MTSECLPDCAKIRLYFSILQIVLRPSRFFCASLSSRLSRHLQIVLLLPGCLATLQVISPLSVVLLVELVSFYLWWKWQDNLGGGEKTWRMTRQSGSGK